MPAVMLLKCYLPMTMNIIYCIPICVLYACIYLKIYYIHIYVCIYMCITSYMY